jgi:hypothetical protein
MAEIQDAAMHSVLGGETVSKRNKIPGTDDHKEVHASVLRDELEMLISTGRCVQRR